MRLSERNKRYQIIAQGLRSNKTRQQIADELGISKSNVKRHVPEVRMIHPDVPQASIAIDWERSYPLIADQLHSFKTNSQIASALGVSESSLRAHLPEVTKRYPSVPSASIRQRKGTEESWKSPVVYQNHVDAAVKAGMQEDLQDVRRQNARRQAQKGGRGFKPLANKDQT